MFTVSQLIAQLERMPQDADVLMETEEFSRYLKAEGISFHPRDNKVLIQGTLWMKGE